MLLVLRYVFLVSNGNWKNSTALENPSVILCENTTLIINYNHTHKHAIFPRLFPCYFPPPWFSCGPRPPTPHWSRGWTGTRIRLWSTSNELDSFSQSLSCWRSNSKSTIGIRFAITAGSTCTARRFNWRGCENPLVHGTSGVNRTNIIIIIYRLRT